MLDRFLHWIFPQTCLSCGQEIIIQKPTRYKSLFSHHICPRCVQQWPKPTGLLCRHCGIPLPDGGERCTFCKISRPAFKKHRSVLLYQNEVRSLLLRLKYKGHARIAQIFGPFIKSLIEEDLEIRTSDVLIPVPLHPSRKRWRGYNQAELLAQAVAKSFPITLETHALIRKRPTLPQSSLGRKARRTNISDAFSVRLSSQIKDRKILLIDDICTTGATLSECALTLRHAGVRNIYAVTLARDIPSHQKNLIYSLQNDR